MQHGQLWYHAMKTTKNVYKNVISLEYIFHLHQNALCYSVMISSLSHFAPIPWCPLLSYGYSYKHPEPDQAKPSFVIFDIWALWRSELNTRVPRCQKLQMMA